MLESDNWTFIHHLQLLIVIGSLSGLNGQDDEIANRLPCKYIDSIDISDGELQPNQSIVYDGVEFTPADYAKEDYDGDAGDQIIPQQSHIRGCLCNRKPCIRFCCPHGQVARVRNSTKQCEPHDDAHRFDTELLQNNTKKFAFVNNKPCDVMYKAKDAIQMTNVRTNASAFSPTKIIHSFFYTKATLWTIMNTV